MLAVFTVWLSDSLSLLLLCIILTALSFALEVTEYSFSLFSKYLLAEF